MSPFAVMPHQSLGQVFVASQGWGPEMMAGEWPKAFIA